MTSNKRLTILLLLLIMSSVYSTSAKSESSQTIYKFRNDSGVLSFSDRRPKRTTEFEILKFDCYACQSNPSIDWHSVPLNIKDFRSFTQTAANQVNVDESLIRAVIHAESAFKSDALSSQGAMGLMQLMKKTAQALGVENRQDPSANILAGSQYLREQLDNFGDTKLALAAYNAGPTAVKRYKGIPPYPETERYIERVMILKARYEKAL
jgi:soluble lytic murein transglycosylase-like protein